MNKKFLVIIIIVFSFIFFNLLNEKSPDYDDYKEMELLSQKNSIELKKEGYSNLEIKKIENFRVKYNNHLTLRDIVEFGNLKKYGYNNRSLENEAKNNFIYNDNYYTRQDNNLSFTTTIMDFVSDKNRDSVRILIEFEWDKKPYTQNQYIKVNFHNYAVGNIYTLLKYKNTDDEFDVVYRMSEIEPYTNLFDSFYTNIVSKKTISRQNYILKSGILVLDVKSYYEQGIAPLTISSQYAGKSFFGKEKILSEQKIIEVQKILKER